MSKERLLLHSCCAPCSANIVKELIDEYDIIIYFYNPSIYPEDEYLKRKEEMKKVAKEHGIDVLDGDYDYPGWKDMIKGHEKEPEGGMRCEKCISDRLENTALMAMKLGVSYFATTLSVSPHKNSKMINDLGIELTKEAVVEFLPYDFKKDEGYKKSVEESKKLGLYRQNYCGCEFSIRKK